MQTAMIILEDALSQQVKQLAKAKEFNEEAKSYVKYSPMYQLSIYNLEKGIKELEDAILVLKDKGATFELKETEKKLQGKFESIFTNGYRIDIVPCLATQKGTGTLLVHPDDMPEKKER